MKTEQLYLSGKTIRYHTDPWFNKIGQTDADHTWGMLTILFHFNDNPSLNLIKAITYHDCGESKAGDVPRPFKIRYPEVAKDHADKEKEILDDMVGEVIPLTDEELKWQKFCDCIEAQFFMLTYMPELSDRPDWVENYESTLSKAMELGVAEEFIELMGRMKKAKGAKWD